MEDARVKDLIAIHFGMEAVSSLAWSGRALSPQDFLRQLFPTTDLIEHQCDTGELLYFNTDGVLVAVKEEDGTIVACVDGAVAVYEPPAPVCEEEELVIAEEAPIGPDIQPEPADDNSELTSNYIPPEEILECNPDYPDVEEETRRAAKLHKRTIFSETPPMKASEGNESAVAERQEPVQQEPSAVRSAPADVAEDEAAEAGLAREAPDIEDAELTPVTAVSADANSEPVLPVPAQCRVFVPEGVAPPLVVDVSPVDGPIQVFAIVGSGSSHETVAECAVLSGAIVEAAVLQMDKEERHLNPVAHLVESLKGEVAQRKRAETGEGAVRLASAGVETWEVGLSDKARGAAGQVDALSDGGKYAFAFCPSPDGGSMTASRISFVGAVMFMGEDFDPKKFAEDMGDKGSPMNCYLNALVMAAQARDTRKRDMHVEDPKGRGDPSDDRGRQDKQNGREFADGRDFDGCDEDEDPDCEQIPSLHDNADDRRIPA